MGGKKILSSPATRVVNIFAGLPSDYLLPVVRVYSLSPGYVYLKTNGISRRGNSRLGDR